MKKMISNIREGVFRSPKWLRNFLDFELHTGEDIKGKVSKAEVRRKWERKWSSISKEDFEKFYADQFPKEYKGKYRSCLLSSDLREIRDEWYGNFELWDRYDKWEKRKKEKEEEQNRIKREIDDLYDLLISDFRSSPYFDKFSSFSKNGQTGVTYTFESGNTMTMCGDQIEYGNVTYTVGMMYKVKFIKLLNEMIDNRKHRPGGSKSHSKSSGAKKSASKWSSHPKGNVYQTIKDTIEQRKEQLKKMPKNDPERASLQNDLDNAERKQREMNNKYKFEGISNFEHFESQLYGSLQYSDVEGLKYELEDVLIELRDEGYNTEVRFSKDYKMHLFITFLDYQSSVAKWEHIKEYVNRINVILDKFTPNTIYYKVIQPDGRVFNRNNRECVGWNELPNMIESLDNKKLCFFSIEYVEK